MKVVIRAQLIPYESVMEDEMVGLNVGCRSCPQASNSDFD